MMKRLLLVLGLLCVANAAQAQSATPLNSIVWDQPATDAASAQAFSFKHYDDGATVGVVFAEVVCIAKAPPISGVFDCRAPFPAFTLGIHTLTLTASNVAGESAKSAVLTFQFVLVPGVPGNVRIQ